MIAVKTSGHFSSNDLVQNTVYNSGVQIVAEWMADAQS